MEQKQRKLIYDITEFKYNREFTKRVPYPFFGLNKITGSAEVGNLVILFGKTNAGKSELNLSFVSHWIQNGEKVVAMFGEHTMKKAQELLYKKVSKYNKDTWITKSYGKDKEGKDLGIYETYISEEDEKRAIEIFKNNLFLYDTRNGFSFDTIIKAFDEGKKKGCTIAILDNQMLLDLETTNELREQTDNTERLRQWAKQNQMVVILIAHARKIEPGRIRLSEYDIVGSSNIANKGTTIMTITRTDTLDSTTKEYKEYSKLLELNYINIKKCDAIIEVVKEKNGPGGFVGLRYLSGSKTFFEVYDPEMIAKKEQDKKDRDIKYGKQTEENIQDKPTLFAPKQQSTFDTPFDPTRPELIPINDDFLPF